jgi:hypothetical protein
MYFKNQLLFAMVFTLFCTYLLYKFFDNKEQADNSILVHVEIVQLFCSRSIQKGSSSTFKFKYQEKIFSRSLSNSHCANLSGVKTVDMYYSSSKDEFLFPSVVGFENYKASLYFFGAIILLCLIPYKLFFK